MALQSLLLVLASVNRLWSGTEGLVLNDSLRVVELLNLFVFPPLSVLVFWLLLEQLQPSRALRIAFLGAVYLFALSYGMHEPANYLHSRCGSGPLCSIIAYQDDELSHFIFFAGFAGIDAVLLLASRGAAVVGRERWFVLVNALLVAGAIVANLAFEEIGLDLVFVAFVAALAVVLWRRRGGLPLIVYFASSYVVGLAVTVVVKLAG